MCDVQRPECGPAWVERYIHSREGLDFVQVYYRRQSAKRLIRRISHTTHPARVDRETILDGKGYIESISIRNTEPHSSCKNSSSDIKLFHVEKDGPKTRYHSEGIGKSVFPPEVFFFLCLLRGFQMKKRVRFFNVVALIWLVDHRTMVRVDI